MYPEGRKGICSDLKGTLVNPVKESPEDTVSGLWSVLVDTHETFCARTLLFTVVVENNGRRGFMFQDLS